MNTLLLFSRSELVDLYGSISKYLPKDINQIHVAYSQKEYSILSTKYNIKNVVVFKNEIRKLLSTYKKDELLVDKIDELIIKNSNGRFNLNSSIQSDRGFSLLNYNESIMLAQIYYLFWNSLIRDNDVRYFIHEPTSLFFNHIAAMICKDCNGLYISPIMVPSDKNYSYILTTGDTGESIQLNYYYQNLSDEEIDTEKERIIQFISKLKKDNANYLSQIIKIKPPYKKLVISSIKTRLIRNKKIKSYDKIIDNIDLWMIKHSPAPVRLKNLVKYKFRLKYDSISSDDTFFYYPFHLEPEAVVLYWGDGIYKGQIKLIENIAAQLPPNTYLYVKDHPHFIGYRNINEYQYLKSIPNIKIINPNIPGRVLTQNSKGVITINGSTGLEGILLNKPVFIFGNSFYSTSKKVIKINNIRDLREELYNQSKESSREDMELYRFVLALLKSTYEGVTDYFGSRIIRYGIDLDQNSNNIAHSIIDLIKIHNNAHNSSIPG